MLFTKPICFFGKWDCFSSSWGQNDTAGLFRPQMGLNGHRIEPFWFIFNCSLSSFKTSFCRRLNAFKILSHSSKFVRKYGEKIFRFCLSDVVSRFHNATRAHCGMKYQITSVILCSVVSIKYFYGWKETLDFFKNFAIQITFDSIKDLFDFQVKIINVF